MLVAYSATRIIIVVVAKIARVVDRVAETVVIIASQLYLKYTPAPDILNGQTPISARIYILLSELLNSNNPLKDALNNFRD